MSKSDQLKLINIIAKRLEATDQIIDREYMNDRVNEGVVHIEDPLKRIRQAFYMMHWDSICMSWVSGGKIWTINVYDQDFSIYNHEEVVAIGLEADSITPMVKIDK